MMLFNRSLFLKAMLSTIAGVLVAVGAGNAAMAQAPAAADDPGKVVQNAAEGMLKDLEANRDAYRKDPAKVNALVEKWLLPGFDTQKAARMVLGKHWRTATDEQKKRFVDAFYQSLLKNYGSALVEFTSDRMRILPAQVNPNGTDATVRTEIKRSNGTRIPVNYTLSKGADGTWKAWDVVIEGISYVKSFRDDFGAEIDQKGIDAVIQRMEKGGKPTAAPGTSTTKS
jgi:phospholipid transport system substrate-binding protein